MRSRLHESLFPYYLICTVFFAAGGIALIVDSAPVKDTREMWIGVGLLCVAFLLAVLGVRDKWNRRASVAFSPVPVAEPSQEVALESV